MPPLPDETESTDSKAGRRQAPSSKLNFRSTGFPIDGARESTSLVIGAGVIGLSIADELSRRGHQVTVLDRHDTARSTSWAASGILPPCHLETALDPLDRLRGYSHSFFASKIASLHRETGIDSELRCRGGWYLACSAGEAAAMAGMVAYWKEQGIACESVALDEIARREPALGVFARTNDRDRRPEDAMREAGIRQAWFAPGECQIRPPRLLSALFRSCEARGVQFVTNVDIQRVDDRDRSGVEVSDGERRWQAEQVVLAGGAATGLIEHRLRLQTSLVPIRGQILLKKASRRLVDSVVNVGHRYVLCRDDGHVLIGSCEEEAGFDFATTPEVLSELDAFACGLIPELATAPTLRSWAGLRPLTFDGFPMIGRVPDSAGIYVASGHFRSGIHFSLGTAKLIADQISGVPTEIDVTPFRVGKQQSHIDTAARSAGG
ncbi:MAG: FAD-dependent oxidoreductase [Planctomycetota bacterium]